MTHTSESDLNTEEIWAQAYSIGFSKKSFSANTNTTTNANANNTNNNNTNNNANNNNNNDLRQEETHAKRCEVLIRGWMDARTAMHGLTCIDATHVCTYDCVSDGNIQPIDETTGLYGCLRSGVYHICNGSSATCRNVELTKEGEYVCTFSGAVLGVKLEETIYGIPDTGRSEFDMGIDPSYEEMKVQHSLEREVAPGEHAAEPIASLGPSAMLPDEKFVRVSKLSANSDTNDDLHINVNNAVRDRSRRRDSSHQRKGGRKGAGKKRQCFSTSSFSTTKQEVSAVLTDLFYNQSERRRINRKRQREARERTRDALRKFYRRQRRAAGRPCRHEAEGIFRRHMDKHQPLTLLVHDTTRLEKYATMVAALWHIIVQTPYCVLNHSRFHVKQHVVGLLYTMQIPFSVTTSEDRQEPLLEADQFLYDNLPHQNDLKEWNACYPKGPHYTKQDVTTGRNNFKKAINSVTCVQERQDMFAQICKLTHASNQSQLRPGIRPIPHKVSS